MTVSFVQEPGGAGLHQDDIDRMAGEVVQFPGDAGAFLRGGQPPFPFCLPLDAGGMFLEFADALATYPGVVSDDPRCGAHQCPERHAGQYSPDAVAGRRMDGAGNRYEKDSREQRCASPERTGIAAVGDREAVKGDHGAERKVDRVAAGDQRDARRAGRQVDRQGGATPGDQRQGAGGHQKGSEAVESAGARVRDAEAAGGQHAP
jgi:hypothetical protein